MALYSYTGTNSDNQLVICYTPEISGVQASGRVNPKIGDLQAFIFHHVSEIT